MLRAFTINAVEQLLKSIKDRIELLDKRGPGIVRNKLKNKYDDKSALQDQQNIENNIKKLADEIIEALNKALKTKSNEGTKNSLTQYFDAIEQIFQSSLNLHERQEIEFAPHENKGQHLEALKSIVEDCREAKRALANDHQLKGELVACSGLAEQLSTNIRSLSLMIDYRVKESKGSIIRLLDPEAFRKESEQRKNKYL
ncbi:MAG: hypothetical protein ACHQJ6_08305 [Candidatus Berkiellales bacterium]